MLIQITSFENIFLILCYNISFVAQIIERHREKLNKKNNEISNLNHKVDSFKKELEYSKINLNEYKAYLLLNSL